MAQRPDSRGRHRPAWLRRAAALALALGVAVVAGCSSTHPLMPTPSLYVGPGARPLFVGPSAERRSPALDLLYMTNRAPAGDAAAGARYGRARSRSLAFGSAAVEFGADDLDWETLKAESVVAQRQVRLDLRLGQVVEQGRFPPLPYALSRTAEGLARSPAALARHHAAAAALQAEIARRLAASPRKEVVLYVHGIRNSFDEAALTLSELCHFLGREFVCALFSWPTGATARPLFGYNLDRESAEYSELHLKQAIRLVAETPGLERLHLVAHSRGTDLLTSAAKALMIESYVMGEGWVRRHKVFNIVLLAPDMDVEVASEKIFSVRSDPDLAFGARPAPGVVMRDGPSRITIYSSPDDRALSLSQWLSGSLRRVGRIADTDVTAEVVDRVQPLTGLFDFIQVAGGRTDFFGHSYFTSNPDVSADLIALLRYRNAPGESGRPLEHVVGPLWKLMSHR